MAGRLSRLNKRTRVALGLAGTVGAAFLLGFLVFVLTLPDPADAVPERLAFEGAGPAGIVALTGGAGARITRAVELHEAGLGERVLISGVNPKITKADLAGHDADMGSAAIFECCVDLGPFAKTTKGNALEARSWLRSQGYTTVYLVTSNFHLPRAKAELAILAPELTIVGVPVDSRSVPAGGWVSRPGAWVMLGKEYVKLLVVRVRSVGQPSGRASA